MTTLAAVSVTTDVFDTAHHALLGPDVHGAMSSLRASLCNLRALLERDDWKACCDAARSHPVHDLLLKSPFTHRAYTKPRGYAGDAVLMDLIYGAPPPSNLSALGSMLYAFEFDSPCFQSVRARRAMLAREIDVVASTRSHAAILSVACGHLREIEWSRAVTAGAVSVTATDQDTDSLDFVRDRYEGYGVLPVTGTVGDLLRRSLRFRNFDLTYAAGLYDYLEDDLASALTATLFRTLRSRGRLLIANFTPAAHDAAFMEAIMDWHLVYRDADRMRALTSRIHEGDIAEVEQFEDHTGHITYLRLVKR